RKVDNISFAVAQAERLPFGDQSLDFVSCRIAPHHFVDVKEFVDEVRRVLRPGGVFGLVDNVSPDDEIVEGRGEGLKPAAGEYDALEKWRAPSHVRCVTLHEWRELISGAGLRERAFELQDKPMVFESWADQMQASAETKQRLRQMVFSGSPALQA